MIDRDSSNVEAAAYYAREADAGPEPDVPSRAELAADAHADRQLERERTVHLAGMLLAAEAHVTLWERALRALVASNGIGDAVLTLQAQASRRDNPGAAQRDNRAAILLELLDGERGVVGPCACASGASRPQRRRGVIPAAAVSAAMNASSEMQAADLDDDAPGRSVVRVMLAAALPHLTDRSAESELLAEARVLAGELRAIAEGRRLPDDDEVDVSVVLWAEGWLLTLAEVGVRPAKGADDA